MDRLGRLCLCAGGRGLDDPELLAAEDRGEGEGEGGEGGEGEEAIEGEGLAPHLAQGTSGGTAFPGQVSMVLSDSFMTPQFALFLNTHHNTQKTKVL